MSEGEARKSWLAGWHGATGNPLSYDYWRGGQDRRAHDAAQDALTGEASRSFGEAAAAIVLAIGPLLRRILALLWPVVLPVVVGAFFPQPWGGGFAATWLVGYGSLRLFAEARYRDGAGTRPWRRVLPGFLLGWCLPWAVIAAGVFCLLVWPPTTIDRTRLLPFIVAGLWMLFYAAALVVRNARAEKPAAAVRFRRTEA